MCGMLCYVRVSKNVLQQMFYDSNVIIQFRWKLICCFTEAMSALTGQKIFHVFPLKIVFWKLVTSVLCNVWGWAPNKKPTMRPCKVPHNCNFSLLSPDKLVKKFTSLAKPNLRIYKLRNKFSRNSYRKLSNDFQLPSTLFCIGYLHLVWWVKHERKWCKSRFTTAHGKI